MVVVWDLPSRERAHDREGERARERRERGGRDEDIESASERERDA